MATGQDAAALASLVGGRRIGPLVFCAMQDAAVARATGGEEKKSKSKSEERAKRMARRLAKC